MRSWAHTWLFFRIVRPVPRLTRLTFVGITAASGLRLCLSPAAGAEVLWPVLVLQVFAVSTGFLTYARRGHFDTLLTAGIGRTQIALIYWLFAALPGVMCWVTLALIDLAVHQRLTLLTGGTLGAVIIVSVLPWATTVAWTRFVGAIGWLLALVLTVSLTSLGTSDTWRELSSQDALPVATGVSLLFPVRLIGVDAAVHGLPLALVVAIVVGAMVVALVCIRRADLPLDAGQ